MRECCRRRMAARRSKCPGHRGECSRCPVVLHADPLWVREIDEWLRSAGGRRGAATRAQRRETQAPGVQPPRTEGNESRPSGLCRPAVDRKKHGSENSQPQPSGERAPPEVECPEAESRRRTERVGKLKSQSPSSNRRVPAPIAESPSAPPVLLSNTADVDLPPPGVHSPLPAQQGPLDRGQAPVTVPGQQRLREAVLHRDRKSVV